MVQETYSTEEQVKFLKSFCSRNYGYRVIGYSIYHEDKNGVSKFDAVGQRDLRKPELQVTSETIFDTASVAKQFAAATLLKLWDNDLKRGKIENFPNGIDTAINHFMDSLNEKFPQCTDFFHEVKKKSEYQEHKIRLRDLLNHTHSLGKTDYEKFYNIVGESSDKPLEPYEAVNTAINVANSDNYGLYDYLGTSNIGMELAAMIIEVISGKSYDEALRETLFNQYGLNKIHTQSEVKNKELFSGNYDIARTCVIKGFKTLDHNKKETLLNAIPALEAETVIFDSNLSNHDYRGPGRAAVKLRTTLDDLAKFGKLFMSGEMFDNDVIKQEILNFPSNKAVNITKSRMRFLEKNLTEERAQPQPNQSLITAHESQLESLKKLEEKDHKFYNLCIDSSEFEKGFIGHCGGTQFTEMHLKYNQVTDDIKVTAFTLENVTNNFAIMVLREVSTLEDRKELAKFMRETDKTLLLFDPKNFRLEDYAKNLMSSLVPTHEQLKTFQEIAEQNPKAIRIFNKLIAIHKDILLFPIESLMDSEAVKEIVPNLIKNTKERDKFFEDSLNLNHKEAENKLGRSELDKTFVELVKSERSEKSKNLDQYSR